MVTWRQLAVCAFWIAYGVVFGRNLPKIVELTFDIYRSRSSQSAYTIRRGFDSDTPAAADSPPVDELPFRRCMRSRGEVPDGCASAANATGTSVRLPCLTTVDSGRTGNRMHQYASLLGIALRNGRCATLGAPTAVSRRASEVAAIFAEISKMRYGGREYDAVFRPADLFLDKSAFHITGDRAPTKLQSWMQSFKYFGHVDEFVRREFEFRRL